MLLSRRRGDGMASGDDLYRLAQLLTAAGQPDSALTVLDEAEEAFRSAARPVDAARCDAGRSNVLENLGRHGDALAAARRWAAWIEQVDDVDDRAALVAQARANVGVRLESAGDYVGALAAHDEAIAGAGDASLAAVMQINRANVLNLLGRSPEAFDALTTAADVLQCDGNDDDLAVVAINAGESLCRMGRPDDGLSWFARAARLVPDGSAEHATMLVETADALTALGAVHEASNRYDEALALVASAPLAWLETRAWAGAATAAMTLGRSGEAAAAFERAAAGHLAAGHVAGWAINEAEAIGAWPPDLPDRQARIELVRDVVAGHDDERWPVEAVRVHLRLAQLTDDPAGIEAHLRRAMTLGRAVGVPHLVTATGVRLGTFLLDAGRTVEAEGVLEAAIASADRVRRRLHTDELLRTFPATVADGYEALVAARIDRGRIDAALELADRGRARALAEGATSSADVARDAVDDELSGIYDRMLALDRGVAVELREDLETRAARLEIDRQRLELTSGSARRDAGPVGVGDVAAGEVQIVYQLRSGQVGAFVRTSSTTTFHPGLVSVSTVAAELEAFRSAGRRALVTAIASPEHLGALATAAAIRLGRLGHLLLGPIADELGSTGRLVVLPTGLLHGVPFHALVVDGRAVIDLTTVSVAPSLSVRRSRRPLAEPGRTVLVGRSTPELPGVDRELDAIAAMRPDALVLRGDDATVDAVTAAIQGAARVHIATHGMFRSTAPLQSGLRLADGWLTGRQTAGLDLRGATIVLSACDTGRAVVHAGDELLGLQRGFLLAGARAVVMSLWPAVDDVAVTTMTTLHHALAAGAPVDEALRQGHLAARDRSPHPWWWAPFFVSGG